MWVNVHMHGPACMKYTLTNTHTYYSKVYTYYTYTATYENKICLLRSTMSMSITFIFNKPHHCLNIIGVRTKPHATNYSEEVSVILRGLCELLNHMLSTETYTNKQSA